MHDLVSCQEKFSGNKFNCVEAEHIGACFIAYLVTLAL